MKLSKENIFINLKGKSKEELTELYDFLISVGEKPFRDKEWFLNYSNDNEKVGFSDVHFCGLGDILYKEKTEVTIEQLKEILQPMETFTPIAMKCTQEQFDAIKPKLKDLSIEYLSSFSECNYLVNNLGEKRKIISNVLNNSKENYNREVHEEWNEEIFLKACGIEAETQEEQLRKEAIERGFVNGVEFFGSQGVESDKPMLICDNISYAKPNEGIGIWGLYVNNSWLCYNGTWGTLAEETLEQQLEKAEAEVKRLRETIEDSKIKEGDWVKRNYLGIKIFKANNTHDYRYINSEKGLYQKITDPILLESLNKLF